MQKNGSCYLPPSCICTRWLRELFCSTRILSLFPLPTNTTVKRNVSGQIPVYQNKAGLEWLHCGWQKTSAFADLWPRSQLPVGLRVFEKMKPELIRVRFAHWQLKYLVFCLTETSWETSKTKETKKQGETWGSWVVASLLFPPASHYNFSAIYVTFYS